jgi:HEPN superfamily RiboL-PSP-like protein
MKSKKKKSTSSGSYIEPLDSMKKNMFEVVTLLDIHTDTKVHSSKLQVLNKSSIVLAVACWEAFIEDLATDAFNIILKNSITPDVFPSKVLALAANKLKLEDDERKIWNIAGDGWKNVLEDYKEELFKKSIGKLNTPRVEQIDNIFNQLIGMKKLSRKWHWAGMSNNNAIQKLDELITTRGEISHRAATSKFISKKYARDSIYFLTRLSVKSGNNVGRYIETCTGKNPWATWNFKGTS